MKSCPGLLPFVGRSGLGRGIGYSMRHRIWCLPLLLMVLGPLLGPDCPPCPPAPSPPSPVPPPCCLVWNWPSAACTVPCASVHGPAQAFVPTTASAIPLQSAFYGTPVMASTVAACAVLACTLLRIGQWVCVCVCLCTWTHSKHRCHSCYDFFPTPWFH